MSKYTNIPSELKNFFSEKRKNSIMDMFSTLLVSLRFDNRSLGGNTPFLSPSVLTTAVWAVIKGATAN